MLQATPGDGFKVDVLTEKEKKYIKANPKENIFESHPTRPFVMKATFNTEDGIYEKWISAREIMEMTLCNKSEGGE